MRVFKSTYGGSKRGTARWYVEFTDHTGVVRRVAGFEERTSTQELGARLAKLARLKADGLAPDRELVLWINGLPPRIGEALRRIGLASASDPRRFRPLVDPLAKDKKPSEPKDDLVADFGEILRARRKTEKHALRREPPHESFRSPRRSAHGECAAGPPWGSVGQERSHRGRAQRT